MRGAAAAGAGGVVVAGRKELPPVFLFPRRTRSAACAEAIARARRAAPLRAIPGRGPTRALLLFCLMQPRAPLTGAVPLDPDLGLDQGA